MAVAVVFLAGALVGALIEVLAGDFLALILSIFSGTLRWPFQRDPAEGSSFARCKSLLSSSRSCKKNPHDASGVNVVFDVHH